MEKIKLNVALLKERVPKLTKAAQEVGLRPATVSNLCTGKIPIERAEVKTLVALSIIANCTLDELIILQSEGEMIETGIKVVDLFSPVSRGGTIGLIALPGMGQLVFLSEIFYRMKDKQDYKTIMLLPVEHGPGIDDLQDVSNKVVQDMDEAYEVIISSGENDILFAADRSIVISGEFYKLNDRLQSENITNVTTFLYDPRGDAVEEEEPYGPLDTVLKFDGGLISRKIYPAINPVLSISTVLEGAHLDSKHMKVQQAARKVLRRYRELQLLIHAKGVESIPQSEKDMFLKAQRIEAYLTQPFFVAEPFTKKTGVYVSLHDAIEDLSRILKGEFDHLEVDQLLDIGSLKSVSI
ncbi:helix-turn-helix domain-containing protein [Fictibacillus sp. BK138]|uniref:helix-turn-helix domain-containing protein n=1 Tax=Fictibacillus sp. BK138 TaxID=2512121 RepID=UPI00102925E6|nr:helix-turn-helix domain-containing protein [Fictibacillus sp. BK138]RZT15504.1 F-type H+-transporting ATPase subunit beta [Fictibacillus sp. BK138]